MTETRNVPLLLTLPEAANALRISRTKLYRERLTGRLRTVKLGRCVRVRPEDLRRYIQQAARGDR